MTMAQLRQHRISSRQIGSVSTSSLDYQFANLTLNRAYQIEIVTYIGLVLATVVVALRIYSRRLVRLPLEADDYTVLAALVLYYGCCAIMLYASEITSPSTRHR